MASKIAFDLSHISKEEAYSDFIKLCEVNSSTINQRCRIGNKAIDFLFLPYRLETIGNQGISFIDFLDEKYLTKPYVKKVIDYNVEKKGRSLIVAQYYAFQLYFGTINSFKPIIAKAVYSKYKPHTVLDFCAGWGGRCLGAIASGINYIGFDTNIDLKKPYRQLAKMYPHTSTIKMTFKDSSKIDYSKFKYDMVFSSPPYYKKKLIETYSYMPEYKTRKEFLEDFFLPVVKSTWINLQLGGTYALNIPDYMYDDIKPVLGECNEKFTLVTSPCGSSYSEQIYVWFKREVPLPPPTFEQTKVEVKASEGRGLGVFAKEKLPVGTELFTYLGEALSLKDFKEKYGTDTRYSMSQRRKNLIICGKEEPYLSSNMSHYINEANKDEVTNVYFKGTKLIVCSTIEAGSELLLTYPTNYPRTWLN